MAIRSSRQSMGIFTAKARHMEREEQRRLEFVFLYRPLCAYGQLSVFSSSLGGYIERIGSRDHVSIWRDLITNPIVDPRAQERSRMPGGHHRVGKHHHTGYAPVSPHYSGL